MIKSRRIAWVMVLMIAVAVLAGTCAYAADNAPKIGIVDVQKVYANAPRFKQYMEEIQGVDSGLSKKLEIRSANLMLTEAEVGELIDLKLKATPNDKDNARIKELEDLDRSRDAEFKTLQTTAQPTEDQKTKLKKYQDMQEQSKTIGEKMQTDYNSQLQTKTSEMDDKAKVDLREAVNKVAESKGLTYVFDRAALYFGGTDVTDDVISKLDRKAQ